MKKSGENFSDFDSSFDDRFNKMWNRQTKLMSWMFFFGLLFKLAILGGVGYLVYIAIINFS